jgi:hypothetical protein
MLAFPLNSIHSFFEELQSQILCGGKEDFSHWLHFKAIALPSDNPIIHLVILPNDKV